MIGTQPISFLNTGIPVLLMALAAWLLPAFLSRHAETQRELARSVVLSAALVLSGGAVIFAIIYDASGINVGAAMLDAPTVVGAFFVRLSLLGAVIWGPILALAWYILAQGVERRIGERKARRDEP
ncbi:MAG: hypothetical protein JJ992_25400 [Planctomycetes bacterium]|nr:hypothetical protein [Planctomycetota bacterium]